MFTASNAAEQRKTAPIATAPKPRSLSRSGARTDIVPKRSAGRSTNQAAERMPRSRSAPNRRRGLCGSSSPELGVASAHATSAKAATPIAPNVQPTPTTDASPPTTGPKSAPTTAAAKALPIMRPRRSGGASVTSQPSAPVQVSAEATPCAKRARSSCQASWARPKRTVQTPISESPITTVGLTPILPATTPLGSALTSTPAGYAAASTPAPVLPRPRVSA